MKKKLWRACYITLFVALYLYLLPGCKKHNNESGINVPPQGINCTAVKADAENIQIFPPDNPWNLDISTADTDRYNTQIVAGFASNTIKADFGSGLWGGAPIGIPYIVVCGNQHRVAINY